MKKSTRALVGLVGLDVIIIAGAWWMVIQTSTGQWSAPDPAETISMITSTAGMVVGIVSAILLLAFFIHRRAGN